MDKMIQTLNLLCCTVFVLLSLPFTSMSLHDSTSSPTARGDESTNYLRLTSSSSDTQFAPKHNHVVASSSSPTVSSIPTASPSTSPSPGVLVFTASPTISLKPSSLSEQTRKHTKDLEFRKSSSATAGNGTPSITPTISPTTSYVPYKQPKLSSSGSSKPTASSAASGAEQTSDVATMAPTYSKPAVAPTHPLSNTSASDSIHNYTSTQPNVHEDLSPMPNMINSVSQEEKDSISHVKETTKAMTPLTTQTTAIGSQVLMAFLGAFVTSIFFFTILAIRRRMRLRAETELYTIYDATAGRHLTSQNKTHNSVVDINNGGCSSPAEEQQGRILPDISNSGSSVQLSSLGTIYEHDYEHQSDHSSSSIDQMFQFSIQMSEDISLSTRNSWDVGDYWSNAPSDLPSPFLSSAGASPFHD